MSVVTSLPDVSELGHLDLDAWRTWFVNAVQRVIRWIPADGVAIFYQSDVRVGGAWIDKGYLVVRGAEKERASIVWHKIVCRKPPGTIALGRPSYSHMICVTREPREAPRRPGPDVLPDAGFMPWSRAFGVAACRVACAFLRDETPTRVVIDPFCGRGTVLAVANAMGFDSVGVDIGAKRCRAARALVVSDDGEGTRTGRVRTAREAFAAGARLFDARAFWDAHEVWEERWRIESDPDERRFLQGLIQIAAGFHKLFVMESAGAALRLLVKGFTKLEPLPADLDLAAFRAEVAAWTRSLATGDSSDLDVPMLGGASVGEPDD